MSGSRLPFELIEESEIDAATDRAIRQLLCECFAADAGAYSRSRAWHGSTPDYSVILRDSQAVIAHVSVVVRDIQCGQTSETVAGVQGLCVAPGRRGRRFGDRLLTTAMNEAARRGIRFGLLFCVPELESYYGRQGWRRLDRPVTMLDEHGCRAALTPKNIAMQTRLAGEPFPPGPVDLCGRDW